MLPLHIGHRPTTAAALRVLMPGNYLGPPLLLYRGTNNKERQRRLYGFSWTTDGRRYPSSICGGVVQQTLAPPEAVLLIRKPEDYLRRR
jgi:hypothetical protein